jgi:hypothetical protein
MNFSPPEIQKCEGVKLPISKVKSLFCPFVPTQTTQFCSLQLDQLNVINYLLALRLAVFSLLILPELSESNFDTLPQALKV